VCAGGTGLIVPKNPIGTPLVLLVESFSGGLSGRGLSGVEVLAISPPILTVLFPLRQRDNH